MDTLSDSTDTQLATQIQRERLARDWSLADLATRSGVSKAAISKIERAEVSPSAAILARLATAFDLTLAGLLLKAEGEKPRLTRSSDQPVWRDPATGYVRRQIFSRSDHPLEMVRVELPPGKSVSFPAWSYAHIRQVVWVQSGTLHLTEGEATHALKPGDALGLGAPAPVTFANRGETACTYIVALARS